MKALFRRTSTILSSPAAFSLFLLALCLAAYAPLMTRLGFYWDDFPMAWIATTMGSEGLARYFSTNRPVWGLLYRLTTPLLGSHPLNWQIFALLVRWGSGLLLFWLLRLLWREAPVQSQHSSNLRKHFPAWAAALFVVYPGFSQQFIAFLYSHFFLVFSIFLLSLCLMALALRLPPARKAWYWLLMGLSLLLGLYNMLAMEYFFLLDLLRPLLIWVVLSSSIHDRRRRLVKTFLAWLPFLLVFAGAIYWRSVLFGFQTYQPALMDRVRANPARAIMALLPTVLRDVWAASAGAWAKAFILPDILEVGARNLQRYWIFVAAGGAATAIYWLIFNASSGSRADSRNVPSTQANAEVPAPTSRESLRTSTAAWIGRHAWAWQPLAVGLVALFIAGGPFWLTDLKVGLVFPNDRFTLPFMLGASLVVAALLALLPLPGWVKAGLLGIGLGFAIGTQYQYAIDYNRDWSVQRSMFWQMTWRMPGIQPGTALLSNELPVTHYTDNSLTAPLNWTFDPRNDPREMEYALLYPTLRKEDMLSNLQQNQPIYLNYLAAEFRGSTAQMVAFYYNPPGCLRVLDPDVDIYNWMVPEYLREGLALSSTAPILVAPQPGKTLPQPPASVFGPEISRGWCYYFERADLARQSADWQAVARLGDEAFAQSDYPNDPLERFPFIEGYAHAGNWKRALTLSRDSYAVSPVVMQPMLCRLWQRIEKQTAPDDDRDQTLNTVRAEMSCLLP